MQWNVASKRRKLQLLLRFRLPKPTYSKFLFFKINVQLTDLCFSINLSLAVVLYGLKAIKTAAAHPCHSHRTSYCTVWKSQVPTVWYTYAFVHRQLKKFEALLFLDSCRPCKLTQCFETELFRKHCTTAP